eukprot:gene2950-3525_t
MELAYLNREYFHWNDDIAAFEIHFPRNLTKRDSYLRRHVGASYAHSEGSSHSAISEFLGHKGAGTVETYIHYDYKPGINFYQLLQAFENLYE